MAKPLFSVIIPALNEEKYIERILSALEKQTLSDFEVIVVDANSTDKTADVAKGFKKSLPLELVSTPIHNVAHSRNLGAEKAHGEFLFFIDADNSIDTNFLTEANFYVKEGFDAIIAKIVPSKKNTINNTNYFFLNEIVALSQLTPRKFSTGGSLIVRKSVFDQISGFDTKVFIAEDHDLIRRLAKAKAKIVFGRKTIVIFNTRRTEKEGFISYYKWLYSSIYMIIFNKVRKKIYAYEMGGENF